MAAADEQTRRIQAEVEEAMNRQCEPLWSEFLGNLSNPPWLAPVNWFKHSPFGRNWERYAKENLLVEVPHPYEKNLQVNPREKIFALGHLKTYAGYYALVNYVKIPGDTASDKYSWILLFQDEVKPFGYCYANKLTLHPMRTTRLPLQELVNCTITLLDVSAFSEGLPVPRLEKFLFKKLEKEVNRCASRFKLNEIVEVVHPSDSGLYVLANVTCIVGDRIYVKYFEEEDSSERQSSNKPKNAKEAALDEIRKRFWHFMTSPEVHKLGWHQLVGAPLLGGESINLLFQADLSDTFDFPVFPANYRITGNTVFEIRHPFYNYKIVPGRVLRVLKHGYIMAGTDWTNADEHCQVLLHVTSDFIMPPGFCSKHKIPFENGMNVDNFWELVQREGKDVFFVPPAVDRTPNPFKKGAKLEVIEILEPCRIFPGTVTKVAGRLIQVFFDGLDRSNPDSFQWMSCDSGLLHPAGYAEMVGIQTEKKPDQPMLCDMISFPDESNGR